MTPKAPMKALMSKRENMQGDFSVFQKDVFANHTIPVFVRPAP
jgi:hypothetical protein